MKTNRWIYAIVGVAVLVFAGLNIWKLFLLGIPGQAAILLWFRMFRSTGKEPVDG